MNCLNTWLYFVCYSTWFDKIFEKRLLLRRCHTTFWHAFFFDTKKDPIVCVPVSSSSTQKQKIDSSKRKLRPWKKKQTKPNKPTNSTRTERRTSTSQPKQTEMTMSIVHFLQYYTGSSDRHCRCEHAWLIKHDDYCESRNDAVVCLSLRPEAEGNVTKSKLWRQTTRNSFKVETVDMKGPMDRPMSPLACQYTGVLIRVRRLLCTLNLALTALFWHSLYFRPPFYFFFFSRMRVSGTLKPKETECFDGRKSKSCFVVIPFSLWLWLRCKRWGFFCFVSKGILMVNYLSSFFQLEWNWIVYPKKRKSFLKKYYYLFFSFFGFVVNGLLFRNSFYTTTTTTMTQQEN